MFLIVSLHLSLAYTNCHNDQCFILDCKKSSKNDTWTVMTIVVDENGNFKADYEYKDISEDLVGYYNGWKNRYLR